MRATLVCALFAIACSSSSPAPVADAASDAVSDTIGDAVPEVHDVADASGDADAACTLVAPYSSKNATCNACAQASCCREVNGCLGDPRCNDDYVNCILACALFADDAGDAGADAGGCLAECATKHPVGRAEYDAAIGCVEAACPSCK